MQYMYYVKLTLEGLSLPEAEENPKKNRRTRADRIKKVKETVRDFWKRTLNGENATRRDVEKDHGWKESILSKPEAQPFMDKISKFVEEVKKRKGIKNLNDNDRAKLLRYIYDATK